MKWLYKLVYGKVKKCETPAEWAIEKIDRTEINENCYVSTVFLGLDHSHDEDSDVPVLFETMIFGGEHDGDTWRHETLGKAKRIHYEVVNALKEDGELPEGSFNFSKMLDDLSGENDPADWWKG